MPLFVAQFVVVEENLWFSPSEPYEVSRRSESHRVVSQLFAAANAEVAYSRASSMIELFSDAHCDGPGDRTNIRSVGIHELEEVFLGNLSIVEAINEPCGIDVGALLCGEAAP